MAQRTVVVNCLPGESPSTEQRGDATVKSIAGNLLAIIEHLSDIQRAEALLLLGSSWHPPGKDSAAQRRTLFALLGQAQIRVREDTTLDAQARTDETDPFCSGVLALARTHSSDNLALAHCLQLIFSNATALMRTTIIALDFWKSSSPALDVDVHAAFLPLLHLDVEGFQNFLYPHRKRSLPEQVVEDTAIHQTIRRLTSPKSRFFTRLPERDCGLVCALGGDVRCGYLVGAAGDIVGIQIRALRHTVFLVDTPAVSTKDEAFLLRQALLTALDVPSPTIVDGTIVARESSQTSLDANRDPHHLLPQGQPVRRGRRRRRTPSGLRKTRAATGSNSSKSRQPVRASGAKRNPSSKAAGLDPERPSTPPPESTRITAAPQADWRIVKMKLDPAPVAISGQQHKGRILRVAYTSQDAPPRSPPEGQLDVRLAESALFVFLAFVLAAKLSDSKLHAIDLRSPELNRQPLNDYFSDVVGHGNPHKTLQLVTDAFDKACEKAGMKIWKIRLIKRILPNVPKSPYHFLPEYASLISLDPLRRILRRTSEKSAGDDKLLSLISLANSP